jgi:hypothetical protein
MKSSFNSYDANNKKLPQTKLISIVHKIINYLQQDLNPQVEGQAEPLAAGHFMKSLSN